MLRLARPPVTKNELWYLVKALWNVEIPRKRVCEGHVAPFDAFAEAFFGNASNYALWYGSRGTGKSYMLALLALTKAAVLDINVTLLGGSMAQSQNVHEHVADLLRKPNAPMYAIDKNIQTEIGFIAGNWIRPLPASQKTVRGPHPHMTLLDEIDEMDKPIYDAAMGQAMRKPNARGELINEMVVASSTWQNPEGTFKEVMDDCLARDLPVRTWCYREVLRTEENPTGWMDPDFIERKRNTVTIEMFRVEYELGEPSGTSRAIDVDALNRCLTDAQPIREIKKLNEHLIVFEEPVPHATYATGADWAKENDKTVIATWRMDVEPRALVKVHTMNRKPWPEMIGHFNRTMIDYQGSSAHDATGIGNVVGDLIDETTIKFVMVGRERTRMLTEYINAVEQGAYSIPRAAARFFNAHKAATVADVYGTGDVAGAHLPDEFAAGALGHRAGTRGAFAASGQGTPKSKGEDSLMPTWMKDIDQPLKEPVYSTVQGVVMEVAHDDDIGVFWLGD